MDEEGDDLPGIQEDWEMKQVVRFISGKTLSAVILESVTKTLSCS